MHHIDVLFAGIKGKSLCLFVFYVCIFPMDAEYHSISRSDCRRFSFDWSNTAVDGFFLAASE